MSIDEAIAREKQQGKKQRSHIGTWDDEYSKKCEVYAEEHEQLAEWLEELKELRQCTNIENREYQYFNGFKEGKQVGYNKAIDDFMDILLAERTQCYNFDDSEHNNPIKCVWWNDIEEIAEQLKEG